jgi:hypothetical protein
MQIFLNERSAHGQCRDSKDVNRVVANFVKVLSRVVDYQRRDQQWFGPEFKTLQRTDIRAECILISQGRAGALMSMISDKLVKQRLLDVLGRLKPDSWVREAYQLNDIMYLCQGDLENGSSVAELAERLYQMPDLASFLTNFTNCRFSAHKQVEVSREDEVTPTKQLLNLDVIETIESLEDWASSKGFVPCRYPSSSAYPPRDDQTVLIDIRRFERINLREQNRAVYREIATGYFWYVDNLHYGVNAQLEVFDTLGKHLGTSDLNGVIDVNKKVPGRRITL